MAPIMEATRLATTLTSTLAPALPYLLTAAPTGQVRNIPESAMAADTSLWQKILPRTKQRPGLMDAAVNLAKDWKDAGAQAEFRQELRDLLAADAELFDDLKKEVIHHFVYHHFDPLVPTTNAQPATR